MSFDWGQLPRRRPRIPGWLLTAALGFSIGALGYVVVVQRETEAPAPRDRGAERRRGHDAPSRARGPARVQIRVANEPGEDRLVVLTASLVRGRTVVRTWTVADGERDVIRLEPDELPARLAFTLAPCRTAACEPPAGVPHAVRPVDVSQGDELALEVRPRCDWDEEPVDCSRSRTTWAVG